MSKLLGIINPNADPNDQFARWLWRPQHAIPWETEELIMERIPVDEGNIQFRVIGALPGGHPGPFVANPCRCVKCSFFGLYPDGVFMKLHVNAQLNPEFSITQTNETAPPAPVVPVPSESGGMIAPIVPTEQPVQTLNVATTERLDGETKAQSVRRKAIAMRWQAAQLEKLAQDMEALEAQGLI